MGTCAFPFERWERSDQTLSLPAFSQRLAAGLRRPASDAVYLPLLLEVEPQLRLPSRSGDYFVEERFET